MAHIRWMEADDIDRMVEVILVQARELKPTHVIHEYVIRHYLTQATERKWIAVMIAEVDGKLAGYLSIVIGNLWWSPLKSMTQEHIYVMPEFRGTTTAWQLMRAFAEFALMQEDVAEIYCGINHGVGDIDRVSKFYEKNGFVKVGAIHRFDVSKAIN